MYTVFIRISNGLTVYRYCLEVLQGWEELTPRKAPALAGNHEELLQEPEQEARPHLNDETALGAGGS
jgi:hypothetical protein